MLSFQVVKGAAVVLITGLLCAGLALPSHHAPESAVPLLVNPEQQPVAADPAQRTKPLQELMRERLIKRVSLDKGVDPNTPLKDTIEFFSDRYDLKIEIDAGRFRAVGVERIEHTPVRLPALFHIRLATLLRMTAKQVNGVCLTAAGKVIIVPDKDKIVSEFLANGYTPLPPSSQDEEAQSKVFALMSKAYRDSLRALRSGSGSGTFEFYIQGPNEKEPQLTHGANFTLHFDHKRYYVDLRYQKHTAGAVRQIFIHDNSAAFASTFGKRAHEAEVFETGIDSSYSAFPRDPSRVAKPRIDVDKWIANAGDDIRVEELPEGGFTVHVQKGDVHESCTALARFGYNLSTWKVEVEGRPDYAQQEQATWKKAGYVWHRSSAEELRKTANGRARSVLRFTDFQANVAISPKLFHLAALELPVGAGILDRRENAEPRWHRYQAIPDSGSRRFFDMEAELEGLPGP